MKLTAPAPVLLISTETHTIIQHSQSAEQPRRRKTSLHPITSIGFFGGGCCLVNKNSSLKLENGNSQSLGSTNKHHPVFIYNNKDKSRQVATSVNLPPINILNIYKCKSSNAARSNLIIRELSTSAIRRPLNKNKCRDALSPSVETFLYQNQKLITFLAPHFIIAHNVDGRSNKTEINHLVKDK